MTEKYKCVILLTGDADYNEDVKSGMVDVHVWTGKLKELASLIQRSDLLVTVNTFTMHLGVCLNVKMLAIVGATEPGVVLPKDVARLYSHKASDISLEEVKKKIEGLLA